MGWANRLTAILTMPLIILSTGASVRATEKIFGRDLRGNLPPDPEQEKYAFLKDGRHIMGFSEDGRYFAFQERGVTPGSGLPYWEISIIAIDTGELVGGAPFRSRLNRGAFPWAITSKIDIRGEHLARKPGPGLSNIILSDDVAYPKHVTVAAPGGDLSDAPNGNSISFHLSEKVVASQDCGQHFTEPLKGFTLTMMKDPSTLEAGERQSPRHSVTLHDDQSLPTGRGCIAEYGFSDVLRYKAGDKIVYVILLQTRRADSRVPHRWLAVSHRCQTADCGL